MRPLPALTALALAAASVASAGAAELIDAWTAAQRNDRTHAVARATHAAAQPRRDQAAALWRPQVGLTAASGLAASTTEASGAQFSAPGFGASTGVGFSTSVNSGLALRWAVQAAQPLYNPQRRAEQRQLELAAEAAEIEWRGAQSALMLAVAERYYALALAEESVRVLERQEAAVAAAAREAADRFAAGSVPVTDTHEARARAAGVHAQVLAARTDVQVRRRQLADSIGEPTTAAPARLPAGAVAGLASRPLQDWLADARTGNPGLLGLRAAAEVAAQESAKYARGAATAVDLVAQASREHLGGHGEFGMAGNTATNRMIGVQVSLPLSTGGWRESRRDEAQRQVDKAAAELERAREQVAQQVQATWLAIDAAGGRVEALAQALAASEARLDATRVGVEVGQRTTLDLLNAENDRAAARLALAQARVGLWLDRLRLAAIAGQLDEAALRAADADLAPAAAP